jgi:hypothetical protein
MLFVTYNEAFAFEIMCIFLRRKIDLKLIVIIISQCLHHIACLFLNVREEMDLEQGREL